MVLPTLPSAKRSSEGKKVFGFLGRLHPIKKVENLFMDLNYLRKGMTIVRFGLWVLAYLNMSLS